MKSLHERVAEISEAHVKEIDKEILILILRGYSLSQISLEYRHSYPKFETIIRTHGAPINAKATI
jgi:hypothetical protein